MFNIFFKNNFLKSIFLIIHFILQSNRSFCQNKKQKLFSKINPGSNLIKPLNYLYKKKTNHRKKNDIQIVKKENVPELF